MNPHRTSTFLQASVWGLSVLLALLVLVLAGHVVAHAFDGLGLLRSAS